MKQHTKTPWHIADNNVMYTINAKDGRHVAMVSCYVKKQGDESENKANASFIVKAVNEHERIVRRVEIALSAIQQGLYGVAQVCLQEALDDARGDSALSPHTGGVDDH